MGLHLCRLGAPKVQNAGLKKGPQKCSFGASKRAPKMQFWGFRMAHNKYRIRAPYRASWCWLGYALFGALFLHFYLDETILCSSRFKTKLG